MTTHPIDTEEARFGAEAHLRYGGGGDDLAENVLALLDALAAAEHRATRAEAQSAVRGRAVAIYQARAREAEQREWQGEATIRRQERYIEELESVDVVGLKARAQRAEAQIKAVRDVLAAEERYIEELEAGRITPRTDLGAQEPTDAELDYWMTRAYEAEKRVITAIAVLNEDTRWQNEEHLLARVRAALTA